MIKSEVERLRELSKHGVLTNFDADCPTHFLL